MRKLTSLIFLSIVFFSCSNMERTKNGPNTTVADYFNYGDTSVQTAGIRMIPIKTPVGEFNVWTKRFGHNRWRVGSEWVARYHQLRQGKDRATPPSARRHPRIPNRAAWRNGWGFMAGESVAFSICEAGRALAFEERLWRARAPERISSSRCLMMAS